MWVPPEETDPVLLHAPTRKSIALFGAVNLRFGQLVTQFSENFNAATFETFLRKIIRHRRKGNRLIIVLDNARYHHANFLVPFLEKYRRLLKLSFLPAYSPELNPIERVWKLSRKLCTHNQYFSDLQDLANAVAEQLRFWESPNKTLIRLCGIT